MFEEKNTGTNLPAQIDVRSGHFVHRRKKALKGGASCSLMCQVIFGLLHYGNTPTHPIQLYSVPGNSYDFLFIAKGGGSANKTGLFQQVCPP